MKLWTTALLTLFISATLNGQIQKEHTFNSGSVSYFQVDEHEGYYAVLEGQTVRFYKPNYQLYKQATLPQRTNSEPRSIKKLSKNLFDQDKSNLEFLVRYHDTAYYKTRFSIVRANGNGMKQFNGYSFVEEVNGNPKLLVDLDQET